MKVSAVVVSRMDRPLGRVLDSITPHVDELIVVRGHHGIWARYEAIARAKYDIVYTQDDDAVVHVPSILAQYEPGLVTCNMPAAWRKDYQDGIALVGWGAVFDKDLVYGYDYAEGDWQGAFDRYLRLHGPGWERDPVFARECDRVFTGLSKLKLIDLPIEHMPWANGDDRMCRRAHDPVHGQYLQEIRKRIYAVRGES